MILILLDGPAVLMLSAVAAEFAEVTVILSPPLAEDVDTSMVAGLKGSVKFLKSCKNSKKRKTKQEFFKKVIMIMMK